jgi:3-oxoacyl-[acyl-carrier protein] reductase
MNRKCESAMEKEFAGQVALVTGAGSGIGQATAWLFAERGAAVVVQDIDPKGLEITVGAIRERGSEVLADVSDIADPRADTALVMAAERRFGRLDILVNNAGIGIDRPIEEVDEAAFDRMIAVHVKGSFFTAQAAVAGMKQRRYGRIVNTSSRWSMAGHEVASDYIAAKSAILGLTKAWAKELAAHNITVNAIAPGGVKTAMVRKTLGEEGIAREEKLVPLGRWCEPREIAAAVVFLASPDAGFITGQVLSPNGGKTIVGF